VTCKGNWLTSFSGGFGFQKSNLLEMCLLHYVGQVMTPTDTPLVCSSVVPG